jgi:eukaryotic-like serine/threonine-protein kinase
VARCLTCGRRFAGPAPPCGHEQPARATDGSEHDEGLNVPELRIAGYRLGAIVGRGGFGTVVAAERESDGRAVAVKLVHRDALGARERFLLEARALQTIGPPHVPELHEIGTLGEGSPYMVFELISLPTLDAKLAEWGKPLALEIFIPLADAVLKALEATHAHGFVHRDLKPENIFVQETPAQAKLIDFGIAKQTAPGGEDTTTGLALGTPEYMAPEQCEGQAGIDLRADIYAAGVVMFEMLTARPPFFGSAADVRAAHVGRRPPLPSRVADVPPVFDQLLLRCLAKDPARRFDSVRALRSALAEAAEQTSTTASPAVESRSRRAANQSRTLRMGLVFFEAATDTGRIKQALDSLGGQLASVEGKRCVAIFGLEAGGNPVQRALDSAQALLGQELCVRALVDHDRVRVRQRPDGSQRVFSAAFGRQERFPRDSDPPGVLFTSGALEALPELRTIRVREGVLRELPLEADQYTETPIFQMDELVGRQEPFDALVDSARAAAEGEQPTIATVLSEIGHGKSHLGASVLLYLRRLMPQAQVIQLRSREPIGGENNETLRALLRAALKLPRRTPREHGRAMLIDRLGAELGEEVWSAVALVMGWLSGDATAVRKLSAAPAALRSAATRAAGVALQKMAAAGPVLVMIDDAHYADETTLDAIEYATLAEVRAPLWVCVLAAKSFVSARPSWSKRACQVRRIELGPLDSDSAAELCRRLLRPAENVSNEAIQRMVAQTRGNPLLLVELVRGIKRHGLIRRRGRGNAWFLANDELAELPELPKVEWLAERELATLPPELAAHARLVAQLSAEFTVMEVEGVLAEIEAEGLGDVFPLDPMVSVKRLLSHGLLVLHRDGRYGFRHQLIRDHVAQSTPAELRKQIHHAAFRFYRETRSLPESHRLSQLAQHAAHSGHEETASAIYLDLADQAASRHGYVDAELMYTRALSLLPTSDRDSHMRAHNGRGLMRYRLSRFEDALNDLAKARELARERGDIAAEIEIVLDEATVLDWMRDYRKSRSLVEEAQDLASHTLSPLIEARLCLGVGRVRLHFNQWTEAMHMFERAAHQAESLGDPGYETRVIALLLLATLRTLSNQQETAQATFEEVIFLCESRGDRQHLAGAISNRYFLWLALGDVDKAARDALRCRQIGREIGLSELEYSGSYNLAELYYYAGDLDSARPHLRQAQEIEPSNSKRPLSLLLEARFLIHTGDASGAAEVLARIAADQERARASEDMDALFIDSEDVLYHMVQLAVGEAADEQWQALRERAQKSAQPHDLAEILEIAALVAMRQGKPDKAIGLFEQALEACKRTSHLIEKRIERELASLRS